MTGMGPTKTIQSVNCQGKTVKGRIIGLSDKYPSVLQLSIDVAQFGYIVQPVLIRFSFCVSR